MTAVRFDISPEHAAVLANLLTGQVAHNRLQIANLMEAIANGEILAAKLAAGGTELEEEEVRHLSAFVATFQLLTSQVPGMLTDQGRAMLDSLRPQLDAAKTKINH